jgi:hypothetical protein
MLLPEADASCRLAPRSPVQAAPDVHHPSVVRKGRRDIWPGIQAEKSAPRLLVHRTLRGRSVKTSVWSGLSTNHIARPSCAPACPSSSKHGPTMASRFDDRKLDVSPQFASSVSLRVRPQPLVPGSLPCEVPQIHVLRTIPVHGRLVRGGSDGRSRRGRGCCDRGDHHRGGERVGA